MELYALIVFLSISSFGNSHASLTTNITDCRKELQTITHDYKATWFEANHVCHQTGAKWMGFTDGLLSTKSTLTPSHFEKVINCKNFVFWTGIFKPYSSTSNGVNKWFVSTGNTSLPVKVYFNSIGQESTTSNEIKCLAIKRTNVVGESIFTLETCSNNKSFFCNNGTMLSTVTKVISLPENKNVPTTPGKSSGTHSMLFKNCQFYCNSTISGFCSVIPTGDVIDDVTTCSLKKNDTDSSFVLNFTRKHAKDKLNILAQGNITCVPIKLGNLSEYWNKFPELVSNETGVSQGCCECPLDKDQASLNESIGNFTELLVDMTVPKKSTGRHNRRLTCADDKRQTSKVMGYLGVVTILLMGGLVIVCDLCIPSAKAKTGHIKRVRKKTCKSRSLKKRLVS